MFMYQLRRRTLRSVVTVSGEAGSASCVVSHAEAPCCFTAAMSFGVGPNVACSRKRAAPIDAGSAVGGAGGGFGGGSGGGFGGGAASTLTPVYSAECTLPGFTTSRLSVPSLLAVP